MAAHDAVLLDLDGTLVDSRVPFVRSVNAALAAHGMAPRPADQLHGSIGPPLHQTFAALVDDPALVQPCVDTYRERYRAYSGTETTVFPGIVELLDRLGADHLLVVATSKPQAMTEPLLDALGLRDHFHAVVGPSLDSDQEDKAVTVGRALATLPSGARAVMAGDRLYDVHGAHANQIPVAGVLWGIGSAAELRHAGADVLVETSPQLESAIRAGVRRAGPALG